MTPRLFIFNPGHEAALQWATARHYVPKKEAVQMARDLEGLLFLLMREDDYLWSMRHLCVLNVRGEKVPKDALPPTLHLTLWGNEPHTIRYVQQCLQDYSVELICPSITPTYLYYSHRKASTDLLLSFCQTLGYPDYLLPMWVAPQTDTVSLQQTIQSVSEEVHSRLPDCQLFIKQPFTSSGRGVAPQAYPLTSFDVERLAQRCNKSGGLSIENALSVQQNWAMEFFSDGRGEVNFTALSAFETGAGAKSYAGNMLLPPSQLRELLSRAIGEDVLTALVAHIKQYLTERISTVYEGYIGVDMFTYLHEGEICFHPCVEINLRTTMGVIAHLAQQRYLTDRQAGHFRIYYGKPQDVTVHYRTSSSHRIPLTHPDENSRFYAYIEVET